jgi:uncharacterized protein YabN with tetrapyrrole methylase and pyrophosphatase domain
MAHRILWVTRHKLLAEQKAVFQKKYGKKVVIETKDIRFQNEDELLEFHETMENLYDFIYYVLPKKLKNFLTSIGKVFGIIERPEMNPVRLTVEILHYSLGSESPVSVAKKTFSKQNHSKNYFNRKFFI